MVNPEERSKKLDWYLSIFNLLIPVLVSVAGAALAFWTFSAQKRAISEEVANPALIEGVKRYSKESQEALIKISERVSAIEKQLSTLSKITPETAAAAQLASVQKSFDDFSTRVNKLEQVILQDPAKALEMPLLRNQMESVKTGYQSDLFSIRQEIAQVYDLNKWFVALMFTMALGIIGLAITNFIKTGKKEVESKG